MGANDHTRDGRAWMNLAGACERHRELLEGCIMPETKPSTNPVWLFE